MHAIAVDTDCLHYDVVWTRRGLLYVFQTWLRKLPTGSDPWNIVATLVDLSEQGLSLEDVRRLVWHQLVETLPPRTQRNQPTSGSNSLGWSAETGFTLSSFGSALAMQLRDRELLPEDDWASQSPSAPLDKGVEKPEFDGYRLWWGELPVLDFRQRTAPDQMTLLAALQEEWVRRQKEGLKPMGAVMADPLTGKRGVSQKQRKERFRNARKRLDRGQLYDLRILHFRGDGSGQSVICETVTRDRIKR